MKERDRRMLALCCGTVPEIDEKQGLNAICPKCGLKSGVWNGGMPFLVHNWNRKVGRKLGGNSKLELNGFPGYTFCELEVEFGCFGHTENLGRFEACAFRTPMDLEKHSKSSDGYECVIDENRCLYPIDIVRYGCDKVLHLDWPVKKTSNPVSYVYMTMPCCTDGSSWALLNMKANLARDQKHVGEWLEEAKCQDQK